MVPALKKNPVLNPEFDSMRNPVLAPGRDPGRDLGRDLGSIR